MKRFTLRRWANNPWKLYLLMCIAYASFWQIINAQDSTRAYVSGSNLVGAAILFVSLHLDSRAARHSVERWAYLPLIWSMFVYLSLALEYDGYWAGLWRQENLGVMLTVGIIAGSIHRMVWLTVRPWVIKRRERQTDQLLVDAKAIVEHYTEE